VITSTRIAGASAVGDSRIHIALPLVGLIALCAFSASAYAQQYSLTALGVPAGSSASYGTALNDSGAVVGITSNAGGGAFIYQNGTFLTLPTSAGSSASAAAINASGEVTGTVSTGSGGSYAFLYANGAMQNLGGPTGATSSSGMGINAAGQVTGTFTTQNGLTRSFLYSNGVMLDIGTLGTPFAQTMAAGINASGQITGAFSTSESSPQEAFIYAHGSINPIGTLGGDFSVGNAINTGGEVTGYSANSAGVTDAFLYSGGTMHDLGNLGAPAPGSAGIGSVGISINDAGVVVGFAGNPGDMQAFVYENGKMLNLNSLDTSSPLAADVDLISATSINNSGWILANGFDSQTGQHEAFLLKPLSSAPEPGTLELALAGFVAMLTLGARSERSGRTRRVTTALAWD
jgi:probable HAF family extracellular repeat protein